MQKREAWRELLDSIIHNRSTRERIATEAKVTSVTLSRWASGVSMPRPHNLRLLINALPQQYRDQFQKLIEQEVPFFSSVPEEEGPSSRDIPAMLFQEVINARAYLPDNMRYWTISRMVLQHALRQLDPLALGLVITIVRCMPPTSDGFIHSLREDLGIGTSPWEGSLDHKALFLGANSLAGHVTTTAHYQQIPDLSTTNHWLPIYQTPYEASAAACPILFASRVAGCLLIASTRPNYFMKPEMSDIIQNYASLLALAFEPRDFYPTNTIALHVVPPFEEQKELFASFQQHVFELMKARANTPFPLDSIQANQQVWQQLEAKLLHLASPLASIATKEKIEGVFP